MLKVVQHSKFKTDSKKLVRSGSFNKNDQEELFAVIEHLAQEKPLALKYRDHALIGNWRSHRERHIKPDLLLIYKIEGNILKLIRMGSHSQLNL